MVMKNGKIALLCVDFRMNGFDPIETNQELIVNDIRLMTVVNVIMGH